MQSLYLDNPALSKVFDFQTALDLIYPDLMRQVEEIINQLQGLDTPGLPTYFGARNALKQYARKKITELCAVHIARSEEGKESWPVDLEYSEQKQLEMRKLHRSLFDRYHYLAGFELALVSIDQVYDDLM